MNFWKQFKPKSCSVNLKASTKEAALEELVNNLVSGGSLPEERKAAALEALEARERLATTGVGTNVAIPHVKIEGLDRASCSLSIHKEGLEWAAVDGAPVNIVFTILRPGEAGVDHDPERHLEMMRWISRLGREPDFRRFAVRAKTKTELVDLMKEMSTV